MASITAIEFGGDTCALARTTVSRGEVAVSDAELFNPTAFPGVAAFTAGLRKSRRALGLPRRSRVVVWGLPDGASRKHPAVKEVLTPLTNAGFRVERVVSPCNALAALARVKSVRGRGATCWVAINRGGVAIVVVRPGKQIYAHSFPWDSTIGASGSQARLLQRYSLVSSLSPQIKRAMQEARTNGFPVEAVVTCGNLPDLRSLTMPLIEELDIEVETLDSLDGLIVSPAATEKLTEAAAAIRLACAGVIARVSRPWDDSKRVAAERVTLLLRVAAVLAVLAALAGAYFAYQRWQQSRTTAAVPIATTAQTVPPLRGDARGSRGTPSANRPGPAISGPRAGRASAPAEAQAPPVRTSSPPPTPNAPRTSVQPPVTPPAAPSAGTAATPPPVASAPPPARVPAPTLNAAVPAPPGTVPAPSVPMPRPSVEPRREATEAPPLPQLLSDPRPRVTAILVSNDRRFATVEGGRIVGVGDVLGRRTVVAIEERALILREPSGVRIRVGLGGRLLSPEDGS
jgi:hypothetical protein